MKMTAKSLCFITLVITTLFLLHDVQGFHDEEEETACNSLIFPKFLGGPSQETSFVALDVDPDFGDIVLAGYTLDSSLSSYASASIKTPIVAFLKASEQDYAWVRHIGPTFPGLTAVSTQI